MKWASSGLLPRWRSCRTETMMVVLVWMIAAVLSVRVAYEITVFSRYNADSIREPVTTLHYSKEAGSIPSSNSQPLAYDKNMMLDDILERRFTAMCNGAALPASPKEILQKVAATDEFNAVQVGLESWNYQTLQEFREPNRFYKSLQLEADRFESPKPQPLPYTVLSYGARLEQGQRLLKFVEVDPEQVSLTTYPSVEDAFYERDWISKLMFRKANSFSSMFMWKWQFEWSSARHHLLATLNNWTAFEVIQGLTNVDEVLILEDDAIIVPGFRRKLDLIREQLHRVSGGWDIVHLGACFGIKGIEPVSENLLSYDKTRCFNALLMKKEAMRRILERGAIVDEFLQVDFVVSKYVKELNLRLLLAEPPLAFEMSKMTFRYPCPLPSAVDA